MPLLPPSQIVAHSNEWWKAKQRSFLVFRKGQVSHFCTANPKRVVKNNSKTTSQPWTKHGIPHKE
jgi:hypothetical protein